MRSACGHLFASFTGLLRAFRASSFALLALSGGCLAVFTFATTTVLTVFGPLCHRRELLVYIRTHRNAYVLLIIDRIIAPQ